MLKWLRISIAGIDIHPVAVHLARAAWVLAAQPAIQAAIQEGFDSDITVPVYLGDALQLHSRSGDMFAEHSVTIPVNDEANTSLVFPMALVRQAEDFDSLMSSVADAIEQGDDPYLTLKDLRLTETDDETLRQTIEALQRLHADGRDHIWAYYTRNVVRPVALANQKVDVLIGNPPWLNYNQTIATLRTELERQSKEVYGIWQGGRYATHQDVASLFFTRSTDLYLKHGGVIGMVMPHSALQAGQHAKWRTGNWKVFREGSILAADFTYKMAWDLERLQPNNFFPVPASVVFAQRVGIAKMAQPLAGEVERWIGVTGSDAVHRVYTSIIDTSQGGQSPYADYSRQGAVIVPRRLFFVHETESTAVIQAGQTLTVEPREGTQDKEPWRSVNVTPISSQTIEKTHVFDVHLGETVVPYATLDPLKAVLPSSRANLNCTPTAME